ncbi:MAG TPA: DUF5715 family protein [Gemmatimonadaceae bacterium]|nr:DUF5715 family protein [Gemmatimonadaceae bacterium]
MRLTLVAAILALPAAVTAAGAQTLRGSPLSMARQSAEAERNEFTRLETARDVSRYVQMGLLVRVRPAANYDLAGVSHPYTRPVVLSFVEQISAEYVAACGERLVVTSLTRPDSEQPRNASPESVHPAGMAVDFRISGKTSCRRWMEQKLLAMEKTGAIDATRERKPPHLHVAVFPEQYAAYVRRTTVKVAGME